MSLTSELDRFCRTLHHIRNVFEETHGVLSKVDYEEHFDKNNSVLSQWNKQDEEDFCSAITALPRLLIIGQDSVANAAVINQILGIDALPTIIDDELHPLHQSSSLSHWRSIAIRYGSIEKCQLIPSNQPQAECVADLSDQQSVPFEALTCDYDSRSSPTEYLEVSLNHPMLKDGVEMIIPTLGRSATGEQTFLIDRWMHDCLPLFIYVFSTPQPTDVDYAHMHRIRQRYTEHAICYIQCQLAASLPESEQQQLQQPPLDTTRLSPDITGVGMSWSEAENCVVSQRGVYYPNARMTPLRRELADRGYLLPPSTSQTRNVSGTNTNSLALCELIDPPFQDAILIYYVHRICQSRLALLSSQLNIWHCGLLNLFILTAFDMARDQIITPKRVDYARSQEAILYAELSTVLQNKHDELHALFHRTLEEMRENIENAGAEFNYRHDSDGQTTIDEATDQLQQMVIYKVNAVLADRLTSSLNCLKHTWIGTLTRCLSSLENSGKECVDRSRFIASGALKDMLNAAYALELDMPNRDNLWKTLMRKIGDFLSIGSTNRRRIAAPNDAAWRRQICTNVLDRIIQANIARMLCAQLRATIRHAHEQFQTAITNLDNYHSSRLINAENQRLKLRKQHAPKLARLTMESMAHRDALMYGMPRLGREIGRGQYGVVYSCENWGRFGRCAVKSVVPPDDKHWNDLALEFYYTKSLPEHEHIVKLHGAVIDHGYGGGVGQPAVLLIMEQLVRDLYAAIRAGLNWPQRLQVALDVVEGIRFLHSQGLVHRDIKLKNVLIDERNRGKITDLGFCKPEAMMSGSVVGTPIHMAPELFSGSYDSSVDVYAFGVLFWYICAGHVRLPQAFEQCCNKDQLWHSVRKGLRPEQLSTFDAECWSIMRECWSGDAHTRPHLGNIQPRIQMLLDQFNAQNKSMMPNIGAEEAKARSDALLARPPIRIQRQNRTRMLK